MGPDPENRVVDQDTGSLGSPVSFGFQMCCGSGHCPARTRQTWWISRCLFPTKYPSIAPAEMSNTPHLQFGPLEDDQWGGCRLDPKKLRRKIFQRSLQSEFLGRGEPLCRHTIDFHFVSGSYWYNQVSSMVRKRNRKSFGSHRKNSKFSQTTGTVVVFDPHSGISGPTSRRVSAYPNLHEWWSQSTHVRRPVAQLLIHPKSDGLPRLAHEFDQ